MNECVGGHISEFMAAIVQCRPALHHEVLYLHLPIVLQALHASNGMND